MAVEKSTTALLMGGLGNQLFICASAFGLSRAWNRRLVLSDAWFAGSQRGKRFKDFRRGLLLDRFPYMQEFLTFSDEFPGGAYRFAHRFDPFFGRPNRWIFFESGPGFDEDLMRMPRRYIRGYLQSPRYFEGLRSDVLRMFSLGDEETARLSRNLEQISPGSRRRVMVHVRHEDTLVPGNEWIGLLSTDYYRDSMRSFGSFQSDFLVFSDSPEWCAGQKVFRNALIVRESDPVKTLSMMAMCDDFIIAGSSLSWWGAWLGRRHDKRVLAPVPFFERAPEASWRELIQPGWTKQPAQWALG